MPRHRTIRLMCFAAGSRSDMKALPGHGIKDITMSISITSNFDAGAIEVIDASQPADIRLRVRPDSHADFAQWFYFRVSGARGERLVMTFENASLCAFAD